MFEPVTTVMAAPDLPTENDYTYVDNTTLKKINYYRLKITDESAGFYYSDTISVPGPDERIVLLYPNPVSDQVFLRPGTLTGNAVVKIVDSKGAVVKILSLSIGTADIPINVSQLQPGNYLVSIHAGEMVEMVRFVKE